MQSLMQAFAIIRKAERRINLPLTFFRSCFACRHLEITLEDSDRLYLLKALTKRHVTGRNLTVKRQFHEFLSLPLLDLI